MDKKEKLLLAISVSAIILSSCTTTNTGQSAQDSGINAGGINKGVTHTHNGIAHTHPLPASGLKHSHNIGTGNNQVCQPCGTNTVRQPVRQQTANTGGNCHTHAGRRHCHPLPATGTNHQHNIGTGSTPAPDNNNTFVNTTPLPPVVNPLPPNNTTYYDYTNTDSGNTKYYEPAPATKGAIPHAHNGIYHSHVLPASGLNHNHNGATSFGGSGSSSYYNSGSGNGSNSYGSNSYGNGSYGNGSYTPPPSNAPYSNPTPSYNGGGNFNDTASVGSGSCDTASGNYHIVQPKEGVYRIGVNNGVKRDDIIRLNNLQMPDYTIHPGQCLRLR